jgi:hypothetical protein
VNEAKEQCPLHIEKYLKELKIDIPVRGSSSTRWEVHSMERYTCDLKIKSEKLH